MIRIYVGNLPFTAAYSELLSAFSEYGFVDNLHIITDRDTGRSKGFAFLEMNQEEGRSAIEALNGADYDGKEIEVSEVPGRRSRLRRSNSYHRAEPAAPPRFPNQD